MLPVRRKAERRRFSPVDLSLLAACLVAVAALAVRNQELPEVTTKESELGFKLKAERNVVTVRVVVRDAQGRAVGNLPKEDFRLLDDGKPQIIQEAAVESPASTTATTTPAQAANARQPVAGVSPTVAPPATTPPPTPPRRYLALFFDDIHLSFEDLSRTRDAADRYLETALRPNYRAGIFTSSAENVLDFTDDRAKLRDTLARIIPRPLITTEVASCPPITEYQAYLISVEQDPIATQVATEEYFVCNCLKRPAQAYGSCRAEAGREVDAAARNLLILAETRSERVLRELTRLIRLMSPLPGERSVILISPGFLKFTLDTHVDEMIESALHANVVIGALDAKGLYATAPMGDASEPTTSIASQMGQPPPPTPGRGATSTPANLTQSDLQNIAGFGGEMAARVSQIRADGINRAADTMSDITTATGGVFSRNTNDYDASFRKAGGLPEVYYVLHFSPQDLKRDGKFHSLKVEISGAKGLTVEARRGYYAPTGPLDVEAQAKQELQDLAFTKEEMNEFPIEVSTQFFMPTAEEAKLDVLTHLDLHALRFRKEQGRNLDSLTFVTVLFDQNGKYLKGKQRDVQFRLRDATLDKLTQSGITLKTSFDIQSGSYLLRQIVREGETARLAALNRTLDIP